MAFWALCALVIVASVAVYRARKEPLRVGLEGSARMAAEPSRPGGDQAVMTTEATGRGPSNEMVGLLTERERLAEQLARRRQEMLRRCLGSLSPECPFLAKSGEILREMARCGIVHFDVPLLDVAVEAESRNARRGDSEQEVVEEERVALAREVRNELQLLYGTLKPGVIPPSDVETLNREVAQQLDNAASTAALRRIARERAGLPTDGAGTDVGSAERYWRLRADMGDRYEDALARRLGAVRARSLRQQRDGWARRYVIGSCQSAIDGGQPLTP